MDLKKKIPHQIELHSVQGIKDCFENGLNPNLDYDGKPLFELLISMYTRSPRFKDCVKAFIDYGLEFEDKTLLAVLSDNAQDLEKQLENKPNETYKEINLNAAYTPLKKASLLHVCAEFNHLECAKILIKNGIDVNRKSGTDNKGFGGQTPIFHTVNQNNNSSSEMMDFLLSKGADLSYTVKGIIWGEDLPWETFIPSVNAISYAMFGLLPQMHRDERTISDTVSKLLKHEYGINYRAKNIPNKYLNE
ncbi:ankyrin repeat domain-containing protein [Cognatitamlana onchidii]|uniref:ankyrin repeat domain-containing protein n=1 Tax=Cognatitamlana onchidii TaxID=2562860 RepID=UPI0010A5FEE0|nr:ankyrin repeat domain-containing protein [Algibacter onchidii]